MIPEPPSSADGSPSHPRPRPSLDSLAKDTMENDLWALDDLESKDRHPAELPAVPNARPTENRKTPEIGRSPWQNAAGNDDRAPSKVSMIRPKATDGGTPPLPSRPADDFDDLDHWEDIDPDLEPLAPPAKMPPASDETTANTEAVISETPASPLDSQPNDAEEFAPPLPQKPIADSLHLKWKLTKFECVGLVTLLAVLVIGITSVVIYSLGRLPVEAVRARPNDFPIKGTQLSITTADTYWRAPVLDGKSPDIIRRGTVLIPVVKLTTADGSGAIRVIFRNSDGESVGDIVTRSVQNGQSLEIAATVGFDDIGMHAAYRTGETKPWIVEVNEAPTATAAGTDFKKLFEMNVSTVRR